MLSGVLLVGALLLAEVPAPEAPATPPTSETLKAYEAERLKAGKDADAHVRLALWCEAQGLQAERLRHLALAVLHEPANPMARGLMGLVAYQGRWQRPEAVAEAVGSDAGRAAAVAEYLGRRAKAGDSAEAQWKLAAWCEQNGLKAESVAHLRATVRLDPTREAAWKRLGYRRHNGRWVTDARLAAEKEDADLQRRADRQWRPPLERLRESLGARDAARRDAADAALAAVSDPRAVPSVWAVFAARPDAERQAVAVRVLGGIDAAGASRALAILAVSGRSAEVRRAAAETLTRRDVREYADLLVALIRDPIKYEVRQVGGPNAPGELSVHGKQADVRRLYTPPPVAMPQVLPTDRVAFDSNGMPVILRHVESQGRVQISTEAVGLMATSATSPTPAFAQAFPQFVAAHGGGRAGGEAARAAVGTDRSQAPANVQPAVLGPTGPVPVPNRGTYDVYRSAEFAIPVGRIMAEAAVADAAARQRLDSDVARIDAYNSAVGAVNDLALAVLVRAAGRDLGPDRESWEAWWLDQVGFALHPQKSQERPQFVEQVPIDYQPRQFAPALVAEVDTFVRRSTSCFAAGTPVRTLTGPRPIETLEPGDLVLSQDVTTGALGYHPVLKLHKNPPSTTFRVVAGGDTVVSSAFHRFWVAGRGWVMARDLKPGDPLRTLGGLAAVTAVDDDLVRPVFNLDVADDADFFVGLAGVLVHDNTLPDLRLTPFDAPALARSGGEAATRRDAVRARSVD